MATIFQFRDRVSQLSTEKIESDLLTIVKKNEETVTNMNTDQLFGGKDAKGNDLPDYSKRSVEVFGKRAGPWRLFETGDFYRGFFVKVDKFPISIFSNGMKTGEIADSLLAKGRNPDDIYGLNQANQSDLNKSYILGDLQKTIRDTLGI